MKKGLAFPLMLPAILLLAAGCDDPAAPGEPAVLQIDGSVDSDGGGELTGEPLLLRVFRPDGRGGWGEAVIDAGSGYSMEMFLRDGCPPEGTLEAAARIAAVDHRAIDEDLGEGIPILCQPEPQTINYTLYREIFRAPYAVAGGLDATQGSSFNFSCAATSDGAFCWGPNWSGQLGNPEAQNPAPAPVPVVGGEDFRAVEVGAAHACALDGEGAAWCWGAGGDGQLGVPGLQEAPVPVRVETDLRFEGLAADWYSTCGVTAEGAVHCWGGYGGETPTLLEEDLRFAQVSGSWAHMCGVTEDGSVYCWGENFLGEAGQAESGDYDRPMRVSGINDAIAVSAGGRTTCAIRANGEAHCWGWNCHGQLGRPEGSGANVEPAPVAGGHSFTAISVGWGFTCGLRAEGEAWCWGLNTSGELGTHTEAVTWWDPVPVSGDVRFQSIRAGWRSACGISVDGVPYCWGFRPYLGLGLPIGSAQAGDGALAALNFGGPAPLEDPSFCPAP